MHQPNAEKNSLPSGETDITQPSPSAPLQRLSSWKGEIRSIANDGMGVGTIELQTGERTLRRPIFIPFTAPGDIVETSVDRSRSKYYHGSIKNILQASPHRIPAICPHFTACGGCNLEHVKYDEQLRQKAQQLQFLLHRKSLVLPHDVQVLPAKQQHKYRRRSKIAIRVDATRIIAGFRKYRSHDIIPVKECFIVSQEILALIQLLNTATPSKAMASMPPTTIEAMVVAGENGKLGILVMLEDTPAETHPTLKAFFEDIYARNRELIGNLFFEERHGMYHTEGQVQEHLSYVVNDIRLAFSPEVFIQANTTTNAVLVERVIDSLLASSDELTPNTIIDLYCGIGNFSLPAALHAAQVVGVEGHGRSIEFAKVNATANSITNVTFLHASVEEYARDYAKRVKDQRYDAEHPKATHIIIDPPRTGCTPQVTQSLLGANVKSIIYVSCDPSTLADDLSILSPKYSIVDIVGIDMFPDISHVETVVLLRRKEA